MPPVRRPTRRLLREEETHQQRGEQLAYSRELRAAQYASHRELEDEQGLDHLALQPSQSSTQLAPCAGTSTRHVQDFGASSDILCPVCSISFDYGHTLECNECGSRSCFGCSVEWSDAFGPTGFFLCGFAISVDALRTLGRSGVQLVRRLDRTIDWFRRARALLRRW